MKHLMHVYGNSLFYFTQEYVCVAFYLPGNLLLLLSCSVLQHQLLIIRKGGKETTSSVNEGTYIYISSVRGECGIL